MADLFFLYVGITIVVFVVVFLLLPRYGPHSISRLTCPKCKKKFNYHWIPGASFISIYRGNTRRLRCPYCRTLAVYNIAVTRLNKEQVKLLKSKPKTP
jgi:uncharacterized Zn-finger protein